MTDAADAAEAALDAGAVSLARAVARGAVRAVDAVAGALERIAAVEPRLGAFVAVDDRDDALERAAAVDRAVAAGAGLSELPLAGVPVAVKDNLARAGRPLTAGSAILEGYVAPESATAVARLEAAGAVVVGSTNLDELAMGSSTETSVHGPTANPWDPERVPGGSSGGSAAAVAAGCVPLALGSDTGGSVRQPAAFCGLVGLRPTRGRVSRSGLLAFASSLDQVGPLARSVEDATVALAVLAGPDGRDATLVDEPLEMPLEMPLERPLAPGEARERGGEEGAGAVSLDGVRFGVVAELGEELLEAAARPGWRATLAALEAAGAKLVEVSVPAAEGALAAYSILAAAEASTNLARLDGMGYGRRVAAVTPSGASPFPATPFAEAVAASRSAGFGREATRRAVLGTLALAAGHAERYEGRARRLVERLRGEMTEALGPVDALLTPTAPGGAFRLGARLDDPLALWGADVFTVPASLAALPAVALPTGLDPDGLPLSLQLVGRPFDEAELLATAAACEAVLGFDRRPDREALRAA